MIGSITSGLIGNLKDIGLSKILSITPFVGYIGKLIFMSSSFSVRTFEGLTRKAEARYAEHDVMYSKPVSEFVGNALSDFNFDIVFHSDLGIDPLTEFENLKEMAESGMPQPVFLHGKSWGNFTIRNVEGEEKHWRGGRPAVMVINLTLKEFVDSIPTDAKMKLREDELRRGETGLGGPEKLPGSGEPIQTRMLQ